jgi:hypothetical protein
MRFLVLFVKLALQINKKNEFEELAVSALILTNLISISTYICQPIFLSKRAVVHANIRNSMHPGRSLHFMFMVYKLRTAKLFNYEHSQ